MIINITFHFSVILYIYISGFEISNIVNILVSVIFSFSLIENIIAFVNKRTMSLYLQEYENNNKNKGSRLILFIICIIIEIIIVGSYLDVLYIWPTGLK